MTCVDTSIWIEFFRGKDTSLVLTLKDLLEEGDVALVAPVWIELLVAASKKERDHLGKLFSALPRLYPSRATWKTLEQWTKRAKDKGHSFGLGDLLIAAIAAENNAKIWSLDSDFSRMSQLKFIRSY